MILDHPDKNPEDHDMANEVFKHLQNEINRLECVPLWCPSRQQASTPPLPPLPRRMSPADPLPFSGPRTSWYKVLFVPLHLRLIPTSYPPGKATAQPHRTGSPGEDLRPSLPSLPSSRQGCWWQKLATLWTPPSKNLFPSPVSVLAAV